jgi:alpha-amylase
MEYADSLETVSKCKVNMENKTLVQFFEWYCPADGQHWKWFADEIPHLISSGITAAWLPPAYKGTRGPESEGYDVYDIYDLGEFNQKGSIRTKYGTKEEYTAAVQKARVSGLEIYIDIVLNHMGGADEKERIRVKKVDPSNRLQFMSDEIEIEAYTRFTFPGRNKQHSDFQWNYQCFTGLDYATDLRENAIFSIINEYGEDWEPLTHEEKGNFDYLILNDIETRNPAVREELKRWIKWYYKTVPFDGVRLDAVKHINPSFFMEWLDYIRAEINPDLFALGEFWLSDDLPVILNYIKVTGGRMSLFDAPLHRNLSVASNLKEKYDLRKIFQDALVLHHPELAVTFVDNHDTQPLQSLEEYTEQWFKPHAYALILLRKDGYPCIFYPDLYGACYSGKNEQEEMVEINIPPLECLKDLLMLRKDYAYGEQRDYFDNSNCIGWTRNGISEKKDSGCVVLLSNDPFIRHCKRIELGKNLSGRSYYDFLGNQDPVTIDEEGFGTFTVNPLQAGVWVVQLINL